MPLLFVTVCKRTQLSRLCVTTRFGSHLRHDPVRYFAVLPSPFSKNGLSENS
jgi:hypothetical protein